LDINLFNPLSFEHWNKFLSAQFALRAFLSAHSDIWLGKFATLEAILTIFLAFASISISAKILRFWRWHSATLVKLSLRLCHVHIFFHLTLFFFN